MSKNVVIIVVIVAVVVLGGGTALLLANNNSNNSNSSGNMNMSNGSQSNNQQPTSTDSVTIQNFAFSPASITVKKGTTVTWTNKDATPHTVTQDSGTTGADLDSPHLSQGQTYKETFNTVGTFHYHCSIHPNMTGTVTVTS